MDRPADKSHLPFIDILSALFMLGVLFLHHFDYTDIPFEKSLPLTIFRIFVSFVSVGGFIFLAGFKLARTNLRESAGVYWRHRLLRIYPLYALAVITYFLIIQPNHSMGNVAKHLLGLQMYLPSMFGIPFGTLYFIGLLMVFYLLFFYLRRFLTNTRSFFINSALLFIGLLALKTILLAQVDILHPKIFMFYSLFIGGMFIGKNYERLTEKFLLQRKPVKALPWFFLALVLAIFQIVLTALVIYQVIMIPYLVFQTINTFLTILPLLIIITVSGGGMVTVPKLFQFLSYASYAVYLFHRQIWVFLTALYPSNGSILHWLYTTVAGTVIIVFCGYAIQRGFDRLRKVITSATSPS